jgi:hypothetical protein
VVIVSEETQSADPADQLAVGQDACEPTTDELRPIPDDLRAALAPATHYLREWRDCWLRYREVDCVCVDGGSSLPKHGDEFCLRFENRLGLATIRPFAGGRALEPVHVEVISEKLGGAGKHLAFYKALLNDLFARMARLPFTVAAPTARGVTESLRPPTPIFAYYFLCHYGARLREALGVITVNPHRELRDREDRVRLAEVSEVDPDVLLDILRRPDEWAPARRLPLAERLGGYAPERVWQRRPEETLDTAENRFARHFLRQVLSAADRLRAERWWQNVPVPNRALVSEACSVTRETLAHSFLADVGPMNRFPAGSQVLLRREGYRDLRELWQLFHQARRPLFARLQHAIDLRDIATLYEVWAFFRLVDEIGAVFPEGQPVVEFVATDERGLEAGAVAHFGMHGDLVYNRTFHRGPGADHSYSVALRPDFTWVCDGRPEVVLDAKFRLDWQAMATVLDSDSATPQTAAVRGDLCKMHTYRDALRTVRAAVAVYPGDPARGDECVFYDLTAGRRDDVGLRDLLLGEAEGVGAIPMRPGDDVAR